MHQISDIALRDRTNVHDEQPDIVELYHPRSITS